METKKDLKFAETMVSEEVPMKKCTDDYLHPASFLRNKSDKESGMEKRKYEVKERHTYVTVTVLFFFLNVLLVALNIIAIVYVIKERQVKVEHAPSKICVKCEQLRLHPVDKLENITKFDGDSKCCADKPEHVPALVSYYSEHWMKMETAIENRPYKYCHSGNSEKPKPSIKLVGLNKRQNNAETDGHRRLMWDGSADITINDPDSQITFIETHGVVRIEKSGLYHVYSQLLFEHNSVNNTYHGHPVIFSHKVVKIKAKLYHDSILMSSNTPCVSDMTIHRATSYIGGVFQLEKGDELYVKVHKKEEIAPVPHMNLFGIHMM